MASRIDSGWREDEFVGRAVELEELSRALDSPPMLVRVDGEAGVGKTRLIQEALCCREQPHAVVYGACLPTRDPFPLAPILMGLSTATTDWQPSANPLLGVLAPVLPELADRLAPAAPPLGDDRAERLRLQRALRATLVELGTTVLVVDDVHWAHEATLEFLSMVIVAPPPGLTVLVAHRTAELSPAQHAVLVPRSGLSTTRITVGPLEQKQVAQLAATLMGVRLTREAVVGLWARTGGIPFVVRECARTLIEQPVRAGESIDIGNVENLEIPPTVVEAVTARLAWCDRDSRAIVRAAATFGTPASEGDLTAVAGLSRRAGRASLVEALTMGLLGVDGEHRYACRHPFVQQAVYGALSAPRRDWWHHLAARVLASHDPPPHEEIARHSRLCGEHDGWRTHLEHAADEAKTAGRAGEAVALLQQVLHAPADEADRARLALKLGRTALDGMDHIDTVALLRTLVNNPALSRAVRGELRDHLGMLLINHAGAHEQGYRQLERAVDELREDNPDAAMRVMSCLAMPHLGHQHVNRHLEWLAEAERHQHDVADPETAAAVRVNRTTALLSCGDERGFDLAPQLLTHPQDPALGRQTMRGCLNVADCSGWLGYDQYAKDYLEHGRALGRTLRVTFTAELLEATVVLLDWLSGRWSGLLHRATNLVDRYTHLPRVVAECRLITGGLTAMQGRYREGLIELSKVDVAHSSASSPPVAVTASSIGASVLFQQGQTARALRSIDAAVDLVDSTGIWAWASEVVPVAVEIYTSTDRYRDAYHLVDRYSQRLQGLAAPAGVAALALCRGLVADADHDPDTARQAYQTAEERLTELARPHWLARTRFLLGRSLFAHGHDGTEPLRAAAEAYQALDAPAAVEDCRTTLREHNALSPARPGRRGYGNRLSPRERDAAQLAAEGHSNRHIAATLHISPRTVEQHVARALRKLGVGSHQELGLAITRDPTTANDQTSEHDQ